MSKLLLALGLAALGAFFLAASYTARPVTSAGPYSCTTVIGGSVMGNPSNGGWYPADNFGFERIVPNANWQYIWGSGQDNDDWANPNSSGWSQWPSGRISPCTSNSLTPDRVVLWLGIQDQNQGRTPEQEAAVILQIVATTRSKIPSVQAIILQPVTGGPDHALCSDLGSNSSRGHLAVEAALPLVFAADPTLIMGWDALARTCSDFKDGGHLTNAGGKDQGIKHGNFYLALDGGATPVATNTPTATSSVPTATSVAPTATSVPPTSTPARSVTGCNVRTYYSDGTSYTRSVAVSVCAGLE